MEQKKRTLLTLKKINKTEKKCNPKKTYSTSYHFINRKKKVNKNKEDKPNYWQFIE